MLDEVTSQLAGILASADARTIRLITAYPGSNGPDKAEAVFDGVDSPAEFDAVT